MFIQLKPNAQLNFKRHVELPVGVMRHQYNFYADPRHQEYTARLHIKDCEQVQKKIYCYYCGNESVYIRQAFLHDGSGYNLWIHSEKSANYALCQNCDRAVKNMQYMGRSQELLRSIKKIKSLKPFIFLPTIDSYYSHFSFHISGHLVPKNTVADNTINLLSLNSDELVSRRLYTIDKVLYDLIELATDITRNRGSRETLIKTPLKVNSPLDLNFALYNFDILFIETIYSIGLDDITGLNIERLQDYLPSSLKDLKRKSNVIINPVFSQNKSRFILDDYLDKSSLVDTHHQLYRLLLERLNENIEFNIKDNYRYQNITKAPSVSNIAHQYETIFLERRVDGFGDHTTINTRIKRISFSNIRNFGECSSLNFNAAKSIILIGENGVGKSSFLELLTKCLSSSSRSLNGLISFGKESTDVKIEYDNDLPPTFITQVGKRAKSKNKHTSFNIINISEQRLEKRHLRKKLDFIIENQYQSQIVDLIGYHLKVLFGLTADSELRIINNTVVIYQGNIEKPIENFSSGYLSLFSIYMKVIIDVLRFGGYSNYKINIANAIILIDEIELHLHPKFKKEIIGKLNNVFPETLIFATTHDPLVLSSCTEYDKIVTFKNKGDYTVIDDQLPNVHNYSIEQILTSPIFGLSTVNRHAENSYKIEQYHAALKNKEWDLVDKLQDELADSGYFGNSYREFLAHSIVDMYNSEGITATKEELINELRQSENGE